MRLLPKGKDLWGLYDGEEFTGVFLRNSGTGWWIEATDTTRYALHETRYSSLLGPLLDDHGSFRYCVRRLRERFPGMEVENGKATQ